MEAVSKNPSDAMRRFVGTRRGALTIALAAAAVATIALVAYLKDYRSDVRGGAVATRVIVADRLIPKGTVGDIIATDRLFRPTTVTSDEARSTALADTSLLAGKVATRDIYPGEQLTSSDFRADADRLRGRLTGSQRALGVSVDASHGLVGNLRAGDHVDVFASLSAQGANGRGIVRTIAQDVLVLKAPKGGDGGSGVGGGNNKEPVVLRLTERQSARMAFAADNGKLWFALRPTAGARSSADLATITAQNVAENTTAAGSGQSGK